ncbi:MAG: class I SAM-dependent methyltransferase, partial [Pseudobdellovibrionaceae bacterium]
MTTTRRRVTPKRRPKIFDKYSLYQRAVQSADTDVVFIRRVYKELRGKDPVILREDFCGTFGLSCEWIKLNPKFQAIGIDLDPEPLEYGRLHNFSKLSSDQQKRLRLQELNVLAPELPHADVSIAFNFSYFVFKSREFMRRYLHNCYEHLNKDGGLVV